MGVTNNFFENVYCLKKSLSSSYITRGRITLVIIVPLETKYYITIVWLRHITSIDRQEGE